MLWRSCCAAAPTFTVLKVYDYGLHYLWSGAAFWLYWFLACPFLLYGWMQWGMQGKWGLAWDSKVFCSSKGNMQSPSYSSQLAWTREGNLAGFFLNLGNCFHSQHSARIVYCPTCISAHLYKVEDKHPNSPRKKMKIFWHRFFEILRCEDHFLKGSAN